MRYFLCAFILVFGIGLSSSCYAQKRTVTYRNKHKPIRVSPKKAKVICPIFEESAYPYHGFGFKVGDPVALTYKFYFRKKIGLAVDFGSATSGLYYNHHRQDFQTYTDELVPPDDYPTSEDFNAIYLQHKVNGEYVLVGKLLYQIQADKLYKGLQAYVGLGYQYRTLSIEYDYYYYYPNSNQRERDGFSKEKISQGPEVTLGIEYSYFKIPVSAFLEINVFKDLLSPTPWHRFQGGIGLRYVF